MYLIKTTKKYRRSFAKLLSSGRKADIKKLEAVIDMLVSGIELPSKYKNHFLTGKMSEFQECHIKDDLLLIYYKNETELVIVFVNVGSHSELFR